MTEIWKFPVKPSPSSQVLSAPGLGRLLHLDSTSGGLHLWATVSPKSDVKHKEFMLIGTGWPGSVPFGPHIATCVDREEFVWHLFEVKQ